MTGPEDDEKEEEEDREGAIADLLLMCGGSSTNGGGVRRSSIPKKPSVRFADMLEDRKLENSEKALMLLEKSTVKNPIKEDSLSGGR